MMTRTISLVAVLVLSTLSACGIEPQGGGNDDDGGLATPDSGGETATPAPDARRPRPRPDAGPAADTTPTADVTHVDTTPAADTTPSPDVHTPDAVVTPPPPATLPAPFRSLVNGQLEVSTFYISGSRCAQLRGTLPGVTWSSGPSIQDTNNNAYAEYNTAGIPTGTYYVTYVDDVCPGDAPRTGSGNWAQYGGKDQLRLMTAEARSWIECNWWDSVNQRFVDIPGQDESCGGKITILADGSVHPAGNVGNLNQ